jgi:hypothetical protein
MSLFNRNRGTRDHHLYQREDAHLNLIPMIDILSVMVAFLLVYSANVEVVQNSKGVEIPQSTADSQPKQSVVVMITRDQVFVQGEMVATIAEIRDPGIQLIEPLRAVLARPMVGVDAAAQEGSPGGARDHGAGRQVTAVRRGEEGDDDLHCCRLRQDLAGGPREGAASR